MATDKQQVDVWVITDNSGELEEIYIEEEEAKIVFENYWEEGSTKGQYKIKKAKIKIAK